MQRTPANRSLTAKFACVFCLALVVVVGTVQAVHSHPANALASQHSCSICATPGMSLLPAAMGSAPTVQTVASVNPVSETFEVFRPAATLFIRPPPAL